MRERFVGKESGGIIGHLMKRMTVNKHEYIKWIM